MKQEQLYQIALTLVPNIGIVHAKTLLEQFGSAEAIFKAKKKQLENIEGIGTIRAEGILQFQYFKRAEEEMAFMEKYKIQALFINDTNYPKRLLNCYDSPILLYYRGDADLNAKRIVAVIGTRSNSDYGKAMTDKFVRELASEKVMVVSGLAFGIDTIAHKAALKNSIPTIAVLAHGLDTIYPAENAKIAKQMVAEDGGLLTEFRSGSKPDKHNFPTRNRIVAGMADATVVVETDIKGGSIITAELANGYNKDVFAFPGKTTDLKSKGCNQLIRNNKAGLITSAQDFLEMMSWTPQPEKKKKVQRELFIELTDNERILVDLLAQHDHLQIDDIYLKSQLSTSAVASALLSLELQGILSSLPGKIYRRD